MLRQFKRSFSLKNAFNFTENEQMMKDVISKFAVMELHPKVSEMDEKEAIDPQIVKGMFENGVTVPNPSSWE